MEGSSTTRDFERRVRFCFYQGTCKRRIVKQASLSIGALLGKTGGGSFTGNSEG
jgi:hypothetical protein